MKEETKGALCLLATGVLWGTTGTAQTFAPEGYDPLVIGVMRIGVGGAILIVLALWHGALEGTGPWPFKVTLIGAVSAAAFQLLFFTAVHRTGVAVGTIVGLGSAPISAGLLAYLVRGERPGQRWLAATLLAIVGCSLLLLAGHRGQVKVDPVGLLLAIGSGMAYAIYALSIKALVAQRSALAVMTVVACLGALLVLPLVLSGELAWLLQPRGLLVALYLGAFSFALPMYLFATGLALTPVAVAVTLTLAEPFTAGLLGVIVVGERLPFIGWCGMGMVLGGLVMLTIRSRKRLWNGA